jgi:hypothetical protein
MHSIMVNKEICLGEGASWILDINSPAAIFTLKSAAIRSTFAVQQRCCDALAGRFLPRLKAAPMSGFFFSRSLSLDPTLRYHLYGLPAIGAGATYRSSVRLSAV